MTLPKTAFPQVTALCSTFCFNLWSTRYGMLARFVERAGQKGPDSSESDPFCIPVLTRC